MFDFCCQHHTIDFFLLLQGNSIEPQAKTVAPKHGMQSLGKVPSARRAPQPVNLPSLKSESGSSAPEVIPQSVQNPNPGWTGSAPESNVTSKSAPSPQPVATPIVAVSTAQVSNPTTPATTLVQPAPRQAAPSNGCPLDQQNVRRSTKFQQDFPSLTSDATSGPQTKKMAPAGSLQQPAAAVSPSEIMRQDSPQPQQYGPGPSLRPQTEGSWVQGGRGPATHTQQSPTGQGPAQFVC